MPSTWEQPRGLQPDAGAGFVAAPAEVMLARAGDSVTLVFRVDALAGFRVDASLAGLPGQRVRWTLIGSASCSPPEAGLALLGHTIIAGARTLAEPREGVTIGAGPLWNAVFLHVVCALEVDAGAALKVTHYVRGHSLWVMPFAIRGDGLVA